ncbi:B-cell linker protein isoform X2 [Eleginops maclovinus]|uniref:B-cell linker protein isoform X2 n=1 Tax=Eleginops maclovinus TaxID=56733 RepID=UPI0030803DD1
MQMRSVRAALHILSVSFTLNLLNHLHPRTETKTFPYDLSCKTQPQVMTMSFFGKLKNLVPPTPPKREEDSSVFGWPQDEFDDEDCDMYEAPPCELSPVKVPQTQVEENVYLERTSPPPPPPPQRKAAPPPRPGKPSKPQQRTEDFFHDTKTKKPPEVDRNDKPGRKTKGPPPEPKDEDVYLDPNEDQEDNEELYLDPTAACPPPPRGLPSLMTALMPSPIPMMKPPVPRAQSNPFLPSLNDSNTIEARRVTFPTKLPLPTLGVKPPLPSHLKEAKPSLLNALMPGTKPVVSYGGMRATKQSGNEDKEWFAGDCNRKTAEDLLLRVSKDGAFLIRHSSAQSTRQPYTLAVLYQQKVYNVPVRFLGETQGYALGKEGKKNEEIFNSLDEMISHHKNNQLLLIDSKSQAKHTTYLTHTERP